MAMFPVFLIGLLAGLTLGIAFTNSYNYNKRTTPSEAQFKIKEAEIIRYKSDIELLQKTNDNLNKELEKLRNKSIFE